MKNPFIYSSDNKRYHTYDFYLKRTFGAKVAKIPLDAGFSCPNIDGTKGTGGCTYCSGRGSGDFAGNAAQSPVEQFAAMRERAWQKWPGCKAIAYFQAHTNTYAPVAVLRGTFEPVLRQPGVVGLSIATRPDALEEDVMDYLAELADRTRLCVELGLQSVHEATARRINRCHSYAEFLQGLRRLRARNIPVCVHLINGLPGETREMMLETARAVSGLDIQFVKLHLLHVLRGTPIEQELAAGAFELMERQTYVDIVCDQLELLRPEIVIQRLTGDGARDSLVGPLWSLRKRAVLCAIDKELARRDSFQGRLCACDDHTAANT